MSRVLVDPDRVAAAAWSVRDAAEEVDRLAGQVRAAMHLLGSGVGGREVAAAAGRAAVRWSRAGSERVEAGYALGRAGQAAAEAYADVERALRTRWGPRPGVPR